jgi:hypothetical protein
LKEDYLMSQEPARGNEPTFQRIENLVIFKQVGVKIAMDHVSDDEYFNWLNTISENLPGLVDHAQIAEKPDARTNPPLNTGVYYDTDSYDLLETGSLLRTSCNKITHAFCAFKVARDAKGMRKDHRYMFQGDEKRLIQEDPTQPAAVALVRAMLSRKDEVTPGPYLLEHYGITPDMVSPVLKIDNRRFGFYVWLDNEDALRCSLDRANVSGLRHPDRHGQFSEVELALYPRVKEHVAQDSRVGQLFDVLKDSLVKTFGVAVTNDIKYQRAATALHLR